MRDMVIRRDLLHEGIDCGGGLSFVRADGGCICTICGRSYWKHLQCANSSLPEVMQSSSINREYILHVLCDGAHVKL
jgi:hypothetical protein